MLHTRELLVSLGVAEIDAVQIVRGGGNGHATSVVRSLPEVEALLT
jgi:hypothetical protein